MKNALIIIAMLSLMACSKKTLTTKTMSDNDYVFKKYQKAMVVNFKGRDGCDFALQLETGENLEPNLLPISFQKDSLKVWVRYDIRKNAASICMIGKMIKVRDIKARK